MTQRKRATGFALMDTAFTADAKFVRLARMTDPVSFATAVGVYWLILADARRARSGTVNWDDYSEYSEQIAVLKASKLLTDDGFDPETFDRWAPAYRTPNERPSPSPTVPDRTAGTDTSDQISSDQVLSSPNQEEGDAERVPEGWDAPDAIVAYNDVTGRYPKQPVIDWLNRLSNDHPEEAIATFLAVQYAKDQNLGTLLSRTETALKLDAHKREKADKAARAAVQAKIEEPHRQREREATPEEREQAQYQQKAIRLGLKLGVPVPTDPAEVRRFVMKHGSAA